MSFKDQVINLIIQGRDLFTAEAEKSEKALLELGNQSDALNQRLDELSSQQQAVDAISRLGDAIQTGESRYKSASKALDTLVTAQKAAAAEAKKLEAAQAGAAADTQKLETAWQQAQTELAGFDSAIERARATVAKLSAEQTEGATASKQQAAALAAAKTDLTELERAQSVAGQSAAELARELEQSRANLERAGNAANAAADKKAQYGLEVKKARGELGSLGSSLNRNQTELEKQQAVLSKAGISMDKLAEASKDLKQQQAATETALAGVNQKLERHNTLLEQSKKQSADFGGSIKAATASLFAMAGAYIGVDRLWASLTSVLNQGDKAAAFSAQMTSMMGSIAAGEAATAWIKDFANNTGSQLDTVKTAFARLKAFGIDPTNGSLQAMVDYNARLGGSQEQLEGIILAVGQAWAKQKLQGEEILQLVERGVPVWDLLEKVTGKNAVAIAKLSEQGKLGRDVMQALFAEMGKQASGEAAKSLDRLGGQVNVLGNKWQAFQQQIAESGAYQSAIDFLKDLNAKFDNLNSSGSIKAVAADISAFMSTVITGTRDAATWVKDNADGIVIGLKAAAAAIRIPFNAATSAIATVAQVSTTAWAYMMDGYSQVLRFLGKDELANTVALQAGAMRDVSKAMADQVNQDAKDVENSLKSLGFEVKLSADEMSQAQIDAHNKAALAAEEGSVRQQTAAQQAALAVKTAAEENLLAAQKEVDNWTLKQEAAQSYFNDLSTSGTASLAELDSAQQTLSQSSLQLAMAQMDLADAQKAANQATESVAKSNRAALEEHRDKSIAALNEVRKGFLDGTKTADEYKAALEAAAKAALALGADSKTAVDGVNSLEVAMAKAGITSVNSLKEQEAAAKDTYDQVKAAAEQGITSSFEVEQAYKKWAEAAIKVAEAQGEPVPEILKTEAATQKLRDTLAGVIQKSEVFAKTQQGGASSSEQYNKALDKTRARIEELTRSTNDSTASDKEKAEAAKELTKRKSELERQTLALKEVQELETANYRELKAKQEAVIVQLQNLDYAYQFGRLTQAEYSAEQEQLMKVLQLINASMATYSDETVKAAEATGTATQSLREQQVALEQLEKQTGLAAQYTNLFAGAQAHLEKEFNFSSTAVSDLRARLDDLSDMMARNARVTTGFWGELAKASNEAFGREKDIIESTLRWREFMAVLDGGTYTLRDLDEMAYVATRRMTELDDQSLQTLNAGIAEARERLQGLRDDLSGTVADLKEELDELNGIKKDAALKELERRKEELTAQLEAARAAGDAAAIDSAREALKLAEQIYQTKQKQAKMEAERESAAKKASQATQASTPPPPLPRPQAPATPAPTQASAPATVTGGEITTLRLVLNNQPYDAQMKRTILADLMSEIRRAQQTGG